MLYVCFVNRAPDQSSFENYANFNMLRESNQPEVPKSLSMWQNWAHP